MSFIPDEVSCQIVDFLPVPIQMNVSKRSRTRSIPLAKQATRKIRLAMKANRIRICSAVLLNEHSIKQQRAALSLYLKPCTIDKMLHHILCRSKSNYRQDMWSMCMDDRNMIPYPEWTKDTIVAGYWLGWSPKKILRHVVSKLDKLDLNSLLLILNQ